MAQRTSGVFGSISLTSTAMRFPLTITAPLATGKLLARMATSSSSDASSSMMAPRPSRSTWWIGMVVVPSTTWISSETLSSVGTVPSPAYVSGSRSPWYGYEMVNARGELLNGALEVPHPAAESAPVGWRVAASRVAYEEAVAAM